MKKNSLIIFAFTFFIVQFSFSQKKTITGQVTTLDVIAVMQAKVIAKKGKTEVLTDSLGIFTIECDLKDKLTIKVDGFITETIKVKKINDQNKIDIEIVGDESAIDVAVANGHIRATNAVAAKKQYHAKKKYNYGFNTMTELVTAKFPNFRFVGDEVMMRGLNSLTDASNNKGVLFVLSGSTYNWAMVKNLEVRTVKNLKVLTGTAATRYGAGSGNGVIMIELFSN